MRKIKVLYGNQPVLEVRTETAPGVNFGKEFGLSRDRNPDSGWGQISGTTMDRAKDEDLTPELKQILIEDIAYVYGQDSKKFIEKLNEFGLLKAKEEELKQAFKDARSLSYGELDFYDFEMWYNQKYNQHEDTGNNISI